MLFLERPITSEHIRDFCGRFTEGLRVEYKSVFDQNVRNALPKILSSFANSHGGVLVIGVNAPNGVPQPPFEGFARPDREELPLTVENICLQNVYPPLFPQTSVVASDVADHVFVVVEVEESGEAPHAIENSRKVYVRTGNAANLFDLAEVDLIIDLVKRRTKPLELRERLLNSAQERASQFVGAQMPYVQVSISPTFPRLPICTSADVYRFTQTTQYHGAPFFYQNSTTRVPDGTASATHARPPAVDAQYHELNRYGLLLARTAFRKVPGDQNPEVPSSLFFGNLFQDLLKAIVGIERFYGATAYRGNILIRCSLHNVRGKAMFFLPLDVFGNAIDDFRCYTDIVYAEYTTPAMLLGVQRIDVLTNMLSELTWPFWQCFGEYPAVRLKNHVEKLVQGMGRL